MIRPYGRDVLVSRHISRDNLKSILSCNTEAPVLNCDFDTLLEMCRIADGSFTPIEGFCDYEEMDNIVNTEKLTNGVHFPFPIYLQADLGAQVSDIVIIQDSQGMNLGYMENVTVFEYDLHRLARFIFGTTDSRHPGVSRLYGKGNRFISGKVSICEIKNELSHYCLSPDETRRHIKIHNWKTCVGFQTRNVPHMAHEYLQRIALETHDGLLLHPIIGWKKVNDYRPEVVMESYRYMKDHVYPSRRVAVSGLQLAMRYAGPREAMFHAIIRQNYGCTHFIVGRDHAGVGDFYGKYEAHEMTEKYEEHLDIGILRLKGPDYCKRCRQIVTENSCGHSGDEHVDVSGTIIRDNLLNGTYPEPFMMRSEIVDVIRRFDTILIRG